MISFQRKCVLLLNIRDISTNSMVFINVIMQAKFHLSGSVISRDVLIIYVIYSQLTHTAGSVYELKNK